MTNSKNQMQVNFMLLMMPIYKIKITFQERICKRGMECVRGVGVGVLMGLEECKRKACKLGTKNIKS